MVTMVDIGPVPAQYIAGVLIQAREQGWEKEEVLFSGFVAVNAPVISPKASSQAIAVYTILLKKETQGDKPSMPVFEINGQKIGGV